MCVYFVLSFFVFKQKTAYEMRISDWSSDVCSSNLTHLRAPPGRRSLARARLPADSPRQAPRYRARTPGPRRPERAPGTIRAQIPPPRPAQARKSVVEGKRVVVRVALGGRRLIKKKKDHGVIRSTDEESKSTT